MSQESIGIILSHPLFTCKYPIPFYVDIEPLLILNMSYILSIASALNVWARPHI